MTVVASTDRPTRPEARAAVSTTGTASGRVRLLRSAAWVSVLLGSVLRFRASSALWLDEAISVDLAQLPLGQLGEALRHDGHPPLYYVMLHGWIGLFGTGDLAVRSLAGIVSMATLPLAWAAGRRLGGRRVAMIAVVFMATSPFAIRYGTEARMYAFVTFLALAGYLAVLRALERSTPRRLALVSLIVGAALLTHYWVLWLVGATLAVLVLDGHRRPAQRPAIRRVVGAVILGSVAFAWWLPTFWYQARHTGTPWARSVEPFDAGFDTLLDFGGGKWVGGRLLGPLLAVLVLLALLARPLERWRLQIDLRTVPGARVLVAVAGGTMGLGLLTAVVVSSGFQSRYASVVLPFVLLAAALGVTRLPHRWLRVGAVGAVAVVGLAGAVRSSTTARTQADTIAEVIATRAGPGDVVVYCPDQLRPAVQRELDGRSAPALQAMTYPDGGPRGRVDWVDYRDRIDAEAPADVAERALGRAGPGASVWVVSAEKYRGFGSRCEDIIATLDSVRGPANPIIERRDDAYEKAELRRYPTA